MRVCILTGARIRRDICPMLLIAPLNCQNCLPRQSQVVILTCVRHRQPTDSLSWATTTLEFETVSRAQDLTGTGVTVNGLLPNGVTLG